MSKYFVVLVLIVLFWQCTDPQIEHRRDLVEVAEQINEKCPQMIDSETRLDGIEVKEPNTLIYHYTLVNLLAQNLDTLFFYKAMWPGLISNIKVSPEMKKLRDNDTYIDYSYQDKINKPVYTFHIAPEDYKQ